jgi:hypothetical protein
VNPFVVQIVEIGGDLQAKLLRTRPTSHPNTYREKDLVRQLRLARRGFGHKFWRAQFIGLLLLPPTIACGIFRIPYWPIRRTWRPVQLKASTFINRAVETAATAPRNW